MDDAIDGEINNQINEIYEPPRSSTATTIAEMISFLDIGIDLLRKAAQSASNRGATPESHHHGRQSMPNQRLGGSKEIRD
jgi:hypothetical protein